MYSQLQFDESGLLKRSQPWSHKVAEEIAKHDGITPLTPHHWLIIDSLRDYYQEFGVAPNMSHLCLINGLNKHCGHDLFQSCFEAWRISGLPDPGEEAKTYMHNM